MAIFLPVALIALSTRYICYKIDFIRFSRVPKPFGTSLNDQALSIIKGTLVARGLLSIIMYGATNIFLVEYEGIFSWVILSIT